VLPTVGPTTLEGKAEHFGKMVALMYFVTSKAAALAVDIASKFLERFRFPIFSLTMQLQGVLEGLEGSS
jgi:hypothetical protein